MQPYNEKFYKIIESTSRISARQTVPVILELYQPASVIDVGCGLGSWLATFREHGIADITGVDGDYVSREMLQIPPEKFIPADIGKGVHLDRRFDLAMSLEAAEHIPAEQAELFVESLTRLAPVVLFAAAVPFQGGIRHVNEQWPEYWKDLFARFGYVVVDAVRKRIWHDPRIDYWYRQNMLLFVEEQFLSSNETLSRERELTNERQLAMVHPDLYRKYSAPGSPVNFVRTVSSIVRNSFSGAKW